MPERGRARNHPKHPAQSFVSPIQFSNSDQYGCHASACRSMYAIERPHGHAICERAGHAPLPFPSATRFARAKPSLGGVAGTATPGRAGRKRVLIFPPTSGQWLSEMIAPGVGGVVCETTTLLHGRPKTCNQEGSCPPCTLAEERLLTTVPPLRYMVRSIRNDNACEPCHEKHVSPGKGFVK